MHDSTLRTMHKSLCRFQRIGRPSGIQSPAGRCHHQRFFPLYPPDNDMVQGPGGVQSCLPGNQIPPPRFFPEYHTNSSTSRTPHRLIDGRSINISLGGVHNIVVGSDVSQMYQDTVSLDDLSGIMADGTGVKQQKGRKGELRAVIGKKSHLP